MRNIIIVLLVALIASTASAQKNPLKNKIQRLKAANPKAVIDWESEPAGEPVDKLTVEEFMLQRKDLAEKVIELEFDRVAGLKQSGAGYTARVSFESARDANGVTLLIPKEGLDMFEDYSDQPPGYRKRETVYVQVLKNGSVLGLGERYRKNEPEGERYSW